MAFQSNSETGTQLYEFARWFHEHGISWSGTPAELTSELSDITKGKVVDRGFRDSDELVRWLERSAKVLYEFGVDASVHKSSGQPKRIYLRSTNPGPQIRATAQANHGCETHSVVNAARAIPLLA